MNRKQRRAAAHAGGTRGTPPPAAARTARQSAAALYRAGRAQHGAGRLAEAEAHYRQALLLAPDHAESLHGLGLVAHQLKRHEPAVAWMQRAIAADARMPAFHNDIATAYRALGRVEEAKAHYAAALALAPDYAEAHYNLGNALKGQGRLGEAEGSYRAALALKPDFVEAHYNLGTTLLEQGNWTEALGAATHAVRLKETAASRRLFVDCVKRLRFHETAPEMHDLVLRALAERWGKPRELVRAAISLIKAAPEVKAALAARDPVLPHAVAGNRLLRGLLESAPVCDVALERLLTRLRAALLETATAAGAGGAADDDLLAFASALARQCFINEYVFALDEEEAGRAEALWRAAAAAAAAGRPVPALRLAAAAAYFPLHSLPEAASVAAGAWPACVEALLTQALREPREEAALQGAISRLGAIADEVSLRVRRQYEENPYPRWVATAAPATQSSLGDYLRERFPHAVPASLARAGRCEVLVAGCGTGQETTDFAQQFPQAQFLAVDLSLASLAFAQRMTRALGLDNVRYAQADLLQLDRLERHFDLVVAQGVLHHLADPMAGWRGLLALVRPHGVMCVGLYSALARRDIAAAQAWIAARGYGASPADIRRCRQVLMEGQGEGPGHDVAAWSDFFNMSECRDLLFHVQEHRLTLPAIKQFLAESGSAFLGFEIDMPARRRYASRFPADPTARDLDCWHIFEEENPATFTGMYRFWMQKAA